MRAATLAAGLLASGAVLMLSGRLVQSAAPERQFIDLIYAPPMLPRIVGGDGRVRTPFVYPLVLENRLERRYSQDRGREVPIRWFAGGRILSVDSSAGVPWFPLGTDALGRDVYSRVAEGARVSLGLALLGAAGALLLGTAIGAVAALAGGILDDALMRAADFVIALPAIYVVLTLRAALPLVLSAGQVFTAIAVVFAAVGWPLVARGVRAIVAVEGSREYAEAARAAGAGSTRLLLRHLLPATRGFLAVQATLLIPAFVMAEATLSFAGLGFGEPTPSWGLMLQEAGRGRALSDAPWLLAPAGAIVFVVLAVNLAARTRRTPTVVPPHSS